MFCKFIKSVPSSIGIIAPISMNRYFFFRQSIRPFATSKDGEQFRWRDRRQWGIRRLRSVSIVVAAHRRGLRREAPFAQGSSFRAHGTMAGAYRSGLAGSGSRHAAIWTAMRRERQVGQGKGTRLSTCPAGEPREHFKSRQSNHSEKWLLKHLDAKWSLKLTSIKLIIKLTAFAVGLYTAEVAGTPDDHPKWNHDIDNRYRNSFHTVPHKFSKLLASRNYEFSKLLICFAHWYRSQVLLELSDAELEAGLGVTHPLHRKKLRLAIEEHRHPSHVRYPCIAQLGHTWVSSEWLPDLGLAQYSESFATNMVDARMLDHLSKKELEKLLGVTRKFHQASIVHGIHLLRMMGYDRQVSETRALPTTEVTLQPISLRLAWLSVRNTRESKILALTTLRSLFCEGRPSDLITADE